MIIFNIVSMVKTYTTNIIQPIVHKLSELKLVEIDFFIFFPKTLARAFHTSENSKIILQDIFGNEYNLFQQLFSKSYLLVPLIESEHKNLQDSIVEIKQ